MKQEKKRRKKKRRFSAGQKAGIVFLAVLGLFLAVGITAGAGLMVMNRSGQNRLAKKQEAIPVQMQQETEAPEESEEQLEAGSIRYQGKVYRYKQDIMTFLFMGIDKGGEVKASSNLFKGGQADALFLAALDPEEKR